MINTPPNEPTPLCKAKGMVTVELDRKAMKHFQARRATSWDHEDHLSVVRSRNEAFHSLLLKPEVGNLHRGRITIRRNAGFTIVAALIVGVTNLTILDRWNETLTGNPLQAPPWERHVQTRAIRDNFRNRRAA